MEFLPALKLEDLLTTHPDYRNIAPLYDRIDDLCEGGWRLEQKKRQYLPQRPGEDPKVYETRIKRFSYTNVLGESVGKQIAKLSTGSIDVADGDSETWAAFRAGTDYSGRRSEMQLLQEIFRAILKHGGCYLHVEKESSEVEPQNRLQEILAGNKTYVCLYKRSEVTNWAEDDGELEWIKIQQLEIEPQAFGEAKHKACWTFITSDAIAKYEAYVKLKEGRIVEIDRGDNPAQTGEAPLVPLDEIVPHGFGRIPVVKVESAIDLWTCYGTYLIAQQALDLENSRYDVGAMSYIQRTFKPVFNPDSDLDQTFTEEQILSGNAYILKADSFQFNESSGATIEKLGNYISELHDAIQRSFGQFGSSSSKSPEQLSGLSKQMDFVIQEIMLIAYGLLLIDTYRQVLELAAIALGVPNQIPEVSGLDSFDIDNLDALVAIAKDMPQLQQYIPPTAVKLFAKQLAGLLTKRISGKQQAEIDAEIEAMFVGGVPNSDDRGNSQATSPANASAAI